VQNLRAEVAVGQKLRGCRSIPSQNKGFPLWHVTCDAATTVTRDGQSAGSQVANAKPNQHKQRQEIRKMKLNRMLLTIGSALVLCLGASQLSAQDNNQGGDQGGDRQRNRQGGGPGRGNWDPAQFQQRMLERTKEQLEITDDTEWKAIEPLVQKVMDARMASFSGMGRGGFGRGPRPGGDNGGDQGQRRGGFGTPSPEAEALQKAIDAKASSAELKAAMAKYVEARKQKQADLEKAQTDLRKVLSVRQEAIALESGLL
jgi:hypothetical protein